jgi:hypothetical protein
VIDLGTKVEKAGKYQHTINLVSLSAGLYYVQINISNEIQVKKIIIRK